MGCGMTTPDGFVEDCKVLELGRGLFESAFASSGEGSDPVIEGGEVSHIEQGCFETRKIHRTD